MPSKLTHAVTLLSLLAAVHGSAQAALYAVDTGAVQPKYGNFAQWYQDTHGRVLDLCLSRALSSRVPSVPGTPSYMCTLAVTPGVFDDTKALLFPSNFPDEAFWFLADAAIPTAGTVALNLKYTAALEAAFSGGDPNPGDQISFARIRLRMNVSTPGTYTITHPYGVEVFNITQADISGGNGNGNGNGGGTGIKAINVTRDIGIGAPLDYTGALAGDVGPFLRSVNGPYTETDPQTGSVDRYVGDPNLTEQVTGSPFNTNFVRVEGPGGIDVRTDLFGVTGKLSMVSRPTPVIVQRATYSRKTGGGSGNPAQAQQDVFALAPPPTGTAQFVDTAGATVAMTEANTTGSWYGQSAVDPTLPANLQVTADNHLAIPQNTPTTVAHALVDQITIDTATYSLSSAQLTVTASTSDATTASILSVTSNTGVHIGDLSGDGASKTLSTGITPIPPASVTVTSANGGSDTEEVVITQ